MVARVSELSSLYKFPMGRCEFALRESGRRARLVNVIPVAELAERGANQAREAMRLAMRVASSHRGPYTEAAVALDQAVDSGLAAVHGYLEVQVRAYPGEDRARAAERMSRVLMPDGLGAITLLPFTEEHAFINTLLAVAEEPEYQADIQLLPEIPELLARLSASNREYGAALHPDPEQPDGKDVAEERARAQDTLTAVVGLIVGLYALRPAADHPERDRLLDPILRQNEALRTYRRRRRVPVDVDPDTGEELEAPDASNQSGAIDPEEPGDDTGTPTGSDADQAFVDRDQARELGS